jgi:hypothetical protein
MSFAKSANATPVINLAMGLPLPYLLGFGSIKGFKKYIFK